MIDSAAITPALTLTVHFGHGGVATVASWTGVPPLGNGTRESEFSPVQIGTDSDWAQVSQGVSHVMAIKEDGSLWSWGNNASRQLGDASLSFELTPVRIGTESDWAGVVAGPSSTLAVKKDGSLWGAGIGYNPPEGSNLTFVSVLENVIPLVGMGGGGDTPQNPLDSASSWARERLSVAIGKGFVPTNIQGSYTNVITRAEFCRMAVKWVEYATGNDIDAVLLEKGLSRDPNAFSDTSDRDILAAFALGITSGTGGGMFTPDGQFSREQAATMIMNTCRAIGADVSYLPASGFADIGTASDWAVSGINFVRAHEIMSGTGNDNFSPKGNYTREQSIITFNNINHNTLPGM